MNSQRPNGGSRTTLFPIGALIFSTSVDRLMREYRLDPMPYFQRHARADWGDVSDEKDRLIVAFRHATAATRRRH